ncbi:hypothetical protein ACHQM5_006751 [Ranunculus cassubicifolius]
MAYSYCILLLSVGILFHLLDLVNCKPPLVPALYVFGDSLNDAGNNNLLQTNAQVNFKPYGVDFPDEIPTGRFTNGKTFIDFIAQFLGLPLVPPYLHLTTAAKNKITTGINFASGAGGILPETGSATGNILSSTKQINYFKRTIRKNLRRNFKSRSALSIHLAKSIFFVSVGNNDYINNYLQPASYNSSRIYSPQQFADILIDGLRHRLTRLYKLGARKFVVFDVARIGCTPALVSIATPRPTTPCVEDLNNLVMLFNSRFPSMITALESSLTGSTFVRGDSYSVNQNSTEAGFTTAQIPCCQTSNVTGLCLPDSTPCRDRTRVIFWDAFHPTEVVNRAEAIACFNATSKCVPVNFEQLALKK